jgi:D-arabinose 1-dehydrogenase-like Zn-dependent alcohol dehydrogenase
MRLVVELNRCQGYAQCVFLAPEVFELRGNEALHYDPNPDDAQRLRVLRAAAACPVQAILVEQLDEAVTRIKDMTRGQGAQLVLDIVGVNSTLRMAAQVARMRGDLTIVGLGGGALPVNFFSPPHECSVASTYWGFIPELMEVVTLAQAGKIQMLVEHFPLERAGEAYQLLREGRSQGRAVITPNG